MTRFPWLARLLTVLALAAAGAPVAADTPVLARLEYSSALLAPVAKIRLAGGTVASPLANRPQPVWTLREGDTQKGGARPPERLIRLYQLRGNEAQLIASLFVRYVAGPRGWRPSYALHQLPPAYWDGARLLPIETGPGAPLAIEVVATGEDAGQGFTHALSFRSPAGPLSIDAWEVQ